MTYQHQEAFALMWYACKNCLHRERIWNSRDGVTPFGVDCPSCGATLQHINWRNDVPEPQHHLYVGQRYFRDGTADEAVAIVTRRLESSRKQGMAAPEDVAASLLQEARDRTSEWREGWPHLARQERPTNV